MNRVQLMFRVQITLIWSPRHPNGTLASIPHRAPHLRKLEAVWPTAKVNSQVPPRTPRVAGSICEEAASTTPATIKLYQRLEEAPRHRILA